ncbi:MAG: VOC family protein, partial [Pseudomonadota bacterium]
RPVHSGYHPQLGTETALLGIGPQIYLEVIAMAGDTMPTDKRLPFGLQTCSAPHLATWCARGQNFAAINMRLEQAGVSLGAMREGQRQTPNCKLLTWTFTDIYQDRLDGIVPFFIKWGDTHPSDTLPNGGQLTTLSIRHPSPAPLNQLSDVLPPEVDIEDGTHTELRAEIRLPDNRLIWLG